MPAREYKGVPFEVTIHGRDRAAKAMYKYLRWWGRSNRDRLVEKMRRELFNSILYGRNSMEKIPRHEGR